ncbi:MAG: AraC family transcriptional regulator [Prevotella sp.]|nr:AraC family transcriptional regulator [Prevotella sp.]
MGKVNKTNNMIETDIARIKEYYKGDSIDNDLIIFREFADLPLPTGPRRIRGIMVGLCLKGKAQYSLDTEEHMISPNDIIVISNGQVVENYMFSRDFSGIGLMMSVDFLHEIIKDVHDLSSIFIFSRNHPVFRLDAKEVATLNSYFNIVCEKMADKSHHFRRDVMRSLLMTMTFDLSNVMYHTQITEDKRQTRAEAIFTEFIRSVEKNFKEERRVGWYAEQLCITPKYLSESVKQVSKRTPNEWIDNFVTLETRVLLKNSMLSIKEIAQQLHFPSQSFLGKYFKERVGMSPSEYRKN